MTSYHNLPLYTSSAAEWLPTRTEGDMQDRRPAPQDPEPQAKHDLRIDAPPEEVARAVMQGGVPPKKKRPVA